MVKIILFSISFNFFMVNSYASDSLKSFYDVARNKCRDIPCLRTEMDRINNEILTLLTERTAYVKLAGDIKSKTTKIADDKKRVADQLKKISDKSTELGLPTEISLPSFEVIMRTSIEYQQSYIDSFPLEANGSRLFRTLSRSPKFKF